MNGRALVVAAHGSAEPAVNDGILDSRSRAGRRLGFDEAIAAFHQGDPGSRARSTRCAPTTWWWCRCSRARATTVIGCCRRSWRRTDASPRCDCGRRARWAFIPRSATCSRGASASWRAVLAADHRARDRAGRSRHAPSSRQPPGGRGLGGRSRAAHRPSDARLLSRRRAVGRGHPRASRAGRDLIVLPLLIGAGRHATRDLRRRLGRATAAGTLGDRSPAGARSRDRGDRRRARDRRRPARVRRGLNRSSESPDASAPPAAAQRIDVGGASAAGLAELVVGEPRSYDARVSRTG